MLTFQQGKRVFEVRYSSWKTAAWLMLIPPALIYEYGSSLLDGSIDNSDLAGLWIGVFGPFAVAIYLIEFGRFRFSIDDNRFCWFRRNLFAHRLGEVPLDRVSRIRRDALLNTDSVGQNHSFRLVVVLDDGSIIPLSRGYSGVHDRLLDNIVTRLRNFLGHVEPLR